MAVTKRKSLKVGVVGVGKMGEALVAGALLAKVLTASQVIIFDIDHPRLKSLRDKHGFKLARDIPHLVEESQVIIIAVKPQVMLEVLGEIKPLDRKNKVFVSIAAGITLKTLEKALHPGYCIRVMPNNPCLVGAGVTAFAVEGRTPKPLLTLVKEIFAAMGEVVMVEEKFMSLVTALSGSGPAFIYDLAEAMVEAAEEGGLSKAAALKLVSQMITGAGQTLKQTGFSPAELRQMVSSPGGTTVEGLTVLSEGKVRETFKSAIAAATRRAQQLSQ